jgi:hypothetical protein
MILGIWGTTWFSLQLLMLMPGISSTLPGWSVIHAEISVVQRLTRADLGVNGTRGQMLLWWAIPGASYIFFALFGTSREVISEYARVWGQFMGRIFALFGTLRDVIIEHAREWEWWMYHMGRIFALFETLREVIRGYVRVWELYMHFMGRTGWVTKLKKRRSEGNLYFWTGYVPCTF